jgi:hypothetical protein
MINPSGAPALGEKLRLYISHGGSPQDAAAVANILNAAHSISDVMYSLRRPDMKLVSKHQGIWAVVDGSNNEILAFRLTEALQGATIDIL